MFSINLNSILYDLTIVSGPQISQTKIFARQQNADQRHVYPMGITRYCLCEQSDKKCTVFDYLTNFRDPGPS